MPLRIVRSRVVLAVLLASGTGCGSSDSSSGGSASGSGSRVDSGQSDDADAVRRADATVAPSDGASPPASDDATAADARGADGVPEGGSDDGGAAVERGGFCTSHWCWSHPLPQGNAIRGLWVSPSGRVWAGADVGMLMVWDGAAWQRVDLGAAGAIWMIWGTSDRDIWASDSWTLWHFDGAAWTKDTRPGVPSLGMEAITGSSPNDVWIAADGMVGPAAVHFDGATWSPITGLGDELLWVTEASPTSIWFAAGGSSTGLYRWDGASWSTMSTRNVDNVWATGPSDIWFDDTQTLMRSSGSTFTPVRAGPANFNLPTSRAQTIFGTGPGDMWIVRDGPLVDYWDGGSWSPVTLPPDDAHRLVYGTGAPAGAGGAVIGATSSALWSVRGSNATLVVPPLQLVSGFDLKAVWSDGAGTVIVGGNGGFFTWSAGPDGHDQWTEVNWAGDAEYLTTNGLWGSSATDVWAVGWPIGHYDGSRLTQVADGLPDGNPSGITWHGVYGSGPNDVWVVGSKGALTHFDGTRWTSSQAPGVSDLYAVWVAPSGEAWACGQNGTVYHYTAALGWQRVTAPAVSLTAIWGTRSGEIWVGGDRMYRYDGTSFVEVAIPDAPPLSSVPYVSAIRDDGKGGLLAVSGLSAALHWDGSTWSAEPMTAERLNSLWIGRDGAGWAVGNAGTILRRRP